jgi:hypothetical protein
MIPRLNLTPEECEESVAILLAYLEDQSRIVRTYTMQALADLAPIDLQLRAQVPPVLEEMTMTGSPAMKSPGRMLLSGLGSAVPDRG